MEEGLKKVDEGLTCRALIYHFGDLGETLGFPNSRAAHHLLAQSLSPIVFLSATPSSTY